MGTCAVPVNKFTGISIKRFCKAASGDAVGEPPSACPPARELVANSWGFFGVGPLGTSSLEPSPLSVGVPVPPSFT